MVEQSMDQEALGNRSLLADPRGKDIKEKMNEIKNRQKFRPFGKCIGRTHKRYIRYALTRKSEFMQHNLKQQILISIQRYVIQYITGPNIE